MDRDTALRSLQRDWGEVYEISEALGVWRAVRLRNGRTIVATDPVELGTLIVRDRSIEKVTDKDVPRTPPNSRPRSPDSS